MYLYMYMLKNQPFQYILGLRCSSSFLSLESELSFNSEGSVINFDWARLTTINSLLRALREICKISNNNGEDFFEDEPIVYKEWKATYTVEDQENEKQERKFKVC